MPAEIGLFQHARPILTRAEILRNSYVLRHDQSVSRSHPFTLNDALGRLIATGCFIKPKVLATEFKSSRPDLKQQPLVATICGEPFFF
jgi:hypothetical protein